MRNHYHLLLHESEIGLIAQFMQRLNVSHAVYFNRKYQQVGHLFQGPYAEHELEGTEDVVQASAYIHNNPAKIGKNPETYEWSSYKDYLSGQNSWLQKETILSYSPDINKIRSYQDFVSSARDLVSADLDRPGLETVALVRI